MEAGEIIEAIKSKVVEELDTIVGMEFISTNRADHSYDLDLPPVMIPIFPHVNKESVSL